MYSTMYAGTQIAYSIKYVGIQVMPFLKLATLLEIVHNGSVFWVRNVVKIKKKHFFYFKIKFDENR